MPQSFAITRRITSKWMLVAAMSAAATLGLPAHAQTPIKVIVPYPAGGFTDVVTRQVTAQLTQILKQPVVVDNRPGAGTNLGAEAAANAKPDGNTLFMGTSSLAINPSLYGKQLRYNAQTSFEPLGVFATTGYVLVASPQMAANSVSELIALAKKSPGKLTVGSSGNGSVNHLAAELFKSLSGTHIVHIPYRGAQPAITDLIGGQIDLYFSSVLDAQPLLRAGRVKALGLTTPAARGQLPHVPLIADVVKDYNVEFWMGMFAPVGLPPAETKRLSEALQQVAQDKGFQSDLLRRGVTPAYVAPQDARKLLAAETQRWGDVVKKANAKLD